MADLNERPQPCYSHVMVSTDTQCIKGLDMAGVGGGGSVWACWAKVACSPARHAGCAQSEPV